MDKKHFPIGAYTQLTFAMIIVGSLSVVGKIIIAQFPVMLSSVLALGLASIGMLAVHYVIKGPLPKLNKAQFKYLFFQTVFGVFLFRIFFLYGLYWSSAAMAGVLISLTPVVIAFLSAFLLRESITTQSIFGIVLCCIGMAYSQYQEVIIQRDWMLIAGIGLVLLAVICEALFTVYRKKLSHELLNPVTSNAYLCMIGAMMFLPFGLYDLLNFNLLEVPLSGWMPIFYTALFVNIISFILWFKGVDQVQAFTAGVFTVVMPVSAVILSNLILGEAITSEMIVGMILILTGLILVIIPFPKLRQHKSAETS